MGKDILSAKKMIKVRGELMDLSHPKIMGILNVTPDSFYEGSRMTSEKIFLKRAEEMVSEGVDIIDVGGYSSRPGADHIEEAEEINRISEAIKSLRQNFNTIISIDTFRSNVAKTALDSGADIINDISGGQLDNSMFDLISEAKVPYIMMHMRGTPQTMRGLTEYDDLFAEMTKYFQERVKTLNDRGVEDVILDVGFGFAKTVDQNYDILRNLDYFEVMSRPMLVGVSRKSMVFKTLETTAQEALNGTTVLNTIALLKGASILRVHDVKEASEAIKLVRRTLNQEEN